jgi:hypothetical protein
LFLLPLLQRLGIHQFLQEYPVAIEMALPRQILRAIAHRLAIPATDPIHDLWADLEPMDATALSLAAPADPAEGWRVPDSWRSPPINAPFSLSGLGTKSTSASLPDERSLMIQAWITACRRWCRRMVPMGLHTLVCRPAQVTLTRSHVDMTLDLRQVDVRVRRFGLDLNPGWVPWFNRVVQFHYVQFPKAQFPKAQLHDVNGGVSP